MLCSCKLLHTFNRYIYSTFKIIQEKKIEKNITIPMYFKKPQLEIIMFRKKKKKKTLLQIPEKKKI
jgi:ABC-type lipoprotein export system ATPase subunit